VGRGYLKQLLRFSRWPCVVAMLLALVAATTSAVVHDQPSVEELLKKARAHCDDGDYATALPILDEVINLLQAPDANPQTVASQIATAYELRARVKFETQDLEGAGKDIEAMITASPGHRLADPPARLKNREGEIRRTLVGEVFVTVTPPTASVEIDGRPFVPGSTPVPLLAGPHKITASLEDYKKKDEPFHVAADTTQSVSLTLEREFASLALASVPEGADVYIDGKVLGKTPLTLHGLTVGATPVELRMKCYVTYTSQMDIQKLTNLVYSHKLSPSTGTVIVTTAVPGAAVTLGEKKGETPATFKDVCEGEYDVEVSADYGRYARKLAVKTGETETVTAQLKPVFALLSLTGEKSEPSPDKGNEVLGTVERLGRSGAVGIIRVSAASVDLALGGTTKPGARWLSFDDHENPLGSGQADADTQKALSTESSKALGVQGVATATLATREGIEYVYLSLLASGSGRPDVLKIDLADSGQGRALVERLQQTPELFRPTLGLLAIDVKDVQGAVIARIDVDGPKNLKIGDVITHVNGQELESAGALATMLSKAAPSDLVSLTIRGSAQVIQVPQVLKPRLVSEKDKTALFNTLILAYRAKIASGLTPAVESVVRLNLAVSLMAVGNPAEARKQLELAKENLPSGSGVSKGTAAYLLGVCLEHLREYVEATRQFELASKATYALLTEDGESVSDLALKRLPKAGR